MTASNEWMAATDGLVAYLQRWTNDYAGPPELVISFEGGSERSECMVAWVTVEGPDGFGHLTLWESGELAIEVYDGDTAAAVLRLRSNVSAVADLGRHLHAFVSGCVRASRAEGLAGVDQIVERPDNRSTFSRWRLNL